MAKLVTTIQLRRDTQSNLNSVVLKQGEPAYATDTKKFVIGDGVKTFQELYNISEVPTDIAIKSIEQRFTESLDEDISFSIDQGVVNKIIRTISVGDNIVLLAGQGGLLRYSQNLGDSYSSGQSPTTTGTIVGSAYGQHKFIVVINEEKAVYINDSFSIAANWTKTHTFSKSPECCRYLNGKFYVVGTGGLLAVSHDGYTWTETSGINENIDFYDIVASDNKIIAFGSATQYDNSKIGIYAVINIGRNKQTCVAMPVTINANNIGVIRAAYYVNGNYIIGAQNGVFAWSTDLNNWTQCENPSATNISWVRSFSYGNNILIATMYSSIDSTGEVWKSLDNGKTWSCILTETPFLWSSAFGGDTFFVGGASLLARYKQNMEWKTSSEGKASYYYQYILTNTVGEKIYSNIYKSDSFSEVLGDYYTKGETDSLLDSKLGTNETAADSSKLNNQEPSYYLDYNNFTNTPTIPTKTSDLTNDSGFLTDADMSNFVTLDGEQTIDGEKTFTNGLYIADYKIAPNDFGYFSISDQDANMQLEIHEQDIAFFKNVVAGDYDSYDLGSYDLPWKDLYLSGKITDGENEITINQLLNLKKEITFEEAGFDITTSYSGQILPWIIASTHYSNTNYPYVIKERFIYDSYDDYPILASVIDEIFRGSTRFDWSIWEFEVHVMNSYDISWTVRNLKDGNSYFYSSFWYSESSPSSFKRLNRRDADANIPFPRLEVNANYSSISVHCESNKAIAACNDCGRLELYIYFKDQTGHWTSKPFSGFYQSDDPVSVLPQKQTFLINLDEKYYSFYLDYFKLYTNFNSGPETMPWSEIRTVGATFKGYILINKQKIKNLDDLYSYSGHAHNWLDFKFGLVVHRDDLRFEGPTSETYRLKLKESVKNFSPYTEVTFEEAFEIVAI